jgi:signal peptidase I
MEDYLAPQQAPVEAKPGFKAHIIDLFQTLVVFAAIGTAIYWLVAQPHKVSGSSMFPNFKDGDYIITDKVTYRFSEPERGDIVVFKNPRDETQDFIKRVMGLPGDKVRVQEGKVYLNGTMLTEPYLENTVITYPGSFIREGGEITVEPGHYLVFGDNRPHSSDSREWGFITKQEIIGKVFFRYWPANTMGLYPSAYKITQ